MIKRNFGSFGAMLMLGLAACSGGGGGGGGTAMEPGQWETTAELTRVDIGNLPEEMRRSMRLPDSRTTTTRGCWTMTADVIRVQNLRFTIPAAMTRDARCAFPEIVLEGGTLRGRMSCTGLPGPSEAGAQGMSISSELDGSYTANSLQATGRGEVRFGERSGSGEVRITSRRIGACPPPPRYTPPVLTPGAAGDPTQNVLVPVPMPDRDQSARDEINRAAREARDAAANMGR